MVLRGARRQPSPGTNLGTRRRVGATCWAGNRLPPSASVASRDIAGPAPIGQARARKRYLPALRMAPSDDSTSRNSQEKWFGVDHATLPISSILAFLNQERQVLTCMSRPDPCLILSTRTTRSLMNTS